MKPLADGLGIWTQRLDESIGYAILTHPRYDDEDDEFGDIGRRLCWQVQSITSEVRRDGMAYLVNGLLCSLSVVFWLPATDEPMPTIVCHPVIEDKSAWDVTDEDIETMVHHTLGVIHAQREQRRRVVAQP